MKNLMITCLILIFMGNCFAQNMYWSAYNIKVNAGEEEKFMSTLDRFFSSETGKAIPMAFVQALLFKDSEREYTHKLIFATPDKSQLSKMYSGTMNNDSEFVLLTNRLDAISETVSSNLGKSIEMVAMPQNIYNMIIEMSVADPVSYSTEWRKFRDVVYGMPNNKIGMILHQVLSGNESGVTHITVINAPTFEDLLDFSDKVYSMPAFQNFAAKIKDNRTVDSNTTTVTIKRYNAPTGSE